jgi:hypothetical protein
MQMTESKIALVKPSRGCNQDKVVAYLAEGCGSRIFGGAMAALGGYVGGFVLTPRGLAFTATNPGATFWIGVGVTVIGAISGFATC